MGYDVVILGGGLAGMTAAVRLAGEGLKVCLVEKKSFLGGRTYSIRDRKSGDIVDNGQHILMGCYHETFNLLRTLGTLDGISFQDNLAVTYRYADGATDALQCPALPGPLHLLAGLWRMKTLTWADKWAALKMGLRLRLPNPVREGESVEAFCRRLGQTPRLRQLMWDPIAISALNEDCCQADMNLYREVLSQAFFGSREDSRLALPAVPLQALHADAVTRYLVERGGTVRLNEKVSRLAAAGDAIKAVHLASGEEITAEKFISAMPAAALREIVGASCFSERLPVPDLGSSPILSVYLWYEKPIMEEPLCCLQNCTFEWIFHRNQFMRPGEHKQHCLCLVASAARRFQNWSREQIVQAALQDVNTIYPQAQHLYPLFATVFWEPKATFSPTPENARKRLHSKTDFRNFFLAGDWTHTGVPATIEGAVRSGNIAASNILID